MGDERRVRAEVNLLRLPIFSLATKGLASLQGIELTGTLRRDGESHSYSFSTARSTDTSYPGTLARSAHLALVSIATESLPLENPISWTWRELCRRIGCTCSGMMIEKLKSALRATAGLTIRSRSAIYSKPRKEYLEGAFHLYDTVTFAGHLLPDGSEADQNYLWFSEWFVANLNALYAAPLDYGLWRQLDDQSCLASRAYEFLRLSFYAAPILRINYPTLAGFLPVQVLDFPSQARRQLAPALGLLQEVSLVSHWEWVQAKGGSPQLIMERGPRLEQVTVEPFAIEDVTIREVRTDDEDEVLRARWRPVWDRLSAAEQGDIRRSVVERFTFLTKTPKTLEAMCLRELAERGASER